MRILIAGGGVSGLVTALILARSDHDVVLVERDRFTVGRPDQAVGIERRGVPHFLLPHAFLPRGRREMQDMLPDVYQALLSAGASEFDVARKLRGARLVEDEELKYLFVRRPLIEWALRSAALAQPRLTIRSETRTRGLLMQAGDVPRVVGMDTDVGRITADLVLDAHGRSTPVPKWLDAAGASIRVESSDSKVVYYARYYRIHDGRKLPDGPYLTTPRGDFGYAGFATFGGDNNTFSTLFATGSWDRDLRILQHEVAYEAACRQTPALRPLVDSDFAEPITPVLAMGQLPNTLRHYVDEERVRVTGLLPVGDAVAHTDPTFALGLSFALIHARAVVKAIASAATDAEALALTYWEMVYPEMRERYELAVASDDARAALWQGEAVDFTRAEGCYPLFALFAASAAALQDDDVLRKTSRRIGFLDRVAVFDHDTALHAKIEGLIGPATSRQANPSRAELLQALRAVDIHR
jgi:2-polyprenyl-6-methoxyphenol hydroxylase-like FAD-dependent oxidoreductase